ncbi:MAG: asparagine synthase (glutamine-hydrolyzing) [Pseudomonadota bacterium]
MCGIAGLIDKRGKLAAEERRAAVARMTDAIAHRGPDDAGLWASADGRAVLGHRRLSVIDVSAAGHQPMADSNDTRALVFNGEIYNYLDLRRGLERSGETFRTQTDTEVLLTLLGRQGLQAIPLLDGMYAFGHYDPASRTLLLARDAFGEKPLYYWDGPDYFLFASELSAILASGLFDGPIEGAELAAYLHFRYVPQPFSVFRDIRKLEPGCLLTLDGEGRLEKKRHFAFQLPQNLPLTDPRQIAEVLENELVQAVKSRLVSDVPLGAFLSSGVDSSLVCALATQKLGIPLNTYTIAFDGGESEHEDAARIAQVLGTTHHCHQVSHADLLDVAARMGQILDEPNGDRSCVPTWLLSRFARQDITVALSGDGGDELFAGYGRYFGAQAALGDGLTPAQLAPQYFERFLPVMPLEQLVKLFGGLPDRFQDIYAAILGSMAPARGTIDTLRMLDANSYLPGAVLAKVDRMSMAHGLEVRAPLLALAIARLAGRIPLASHLADGKGKFLLRHILKKYLPAEWVDRRKTGFGMPPAFLKAHADFFGGQLAEAVHDGSALARVLDVRRLRALLPQANNNIVWAVIVLNQWLEKVYARPDRESAGAREVRGVNFAREDNAPVHGRDILDILAKPLPRRLDAPPPGIAGLIADFAAAGVEPAPVNVFTYHTRVDADYRPIETFDIKGLDHRKFDYDYILAYFSHAAAGFFPGANVILVTDRDSPEPPGHRFSHVVRLDVDKDEPMYQRVRAMAAYVNSPAFTATTLFLDSDAFVGNDFRAVLDGDFDVLATFRPDPAMVLNEGVQAASRRRPERVRAFYNGYLATYEQLAQDPDVQARYPHGIKKWRGGQLSLNSVGWDGSYPEAGEIRELDGTRMLYLPCADYNHKPGPSDGLRDLLARQVVHFKGTAKEFAFLRRYTLERNLPGWPLADLLLAAGQAHGEPDAEALIQGWSRLLAERHYAAGKNLCQSLRERNPRHALAQALLALQAFRIEGDWQQASSQARQALAAGPLPEAVLGELQKLLKTTDAEA